MGNIFSLFKSKTVWGVIIGAGTWLIQQPHIQIPEVLQAISAIVTAGGIRDAMKKVGTGK